jgi:hypothetical protein
MFQELAPHLERMALFKVNTGLRDQEVCGLEWEWEIRVPELDTPTIKRSVFVIPGDRVKNTDPRVVVLNDTAQAVVENFRGQHPRYVFTYQARSGRRRALARMNAAGWHAARRRAAKRYAQEFGQGAGRGLQVAAGPRPQAHLWTPIAGCWGVVRGPAGSAWPSQRTDYDALLGGRDRSATGWGQSGPADCGRHAYPAQGRTRRLDGVAAWSGGSRKSPADGGEAVTASMPNYRIRGPICRDSSVGRATHS